MCSLYSLVSISPAVCQPLVQLLSSNAPTNTLGILGLQQTLVPSVLGGMNIGPGQLDSMCVCVYVCWWVHV